VPGKGVTLITIYSRAGCHLCEEMKAVVARTTSGLAAAVRIEEVDISTDPALEARYGLDIPVLTIDGRRAAKYRVTEGELRRLLEGRAARS
jgi:predicted thioredoxin/glutaredoxin